MKAASSKLEIFEDVESPQRRVARVAKGAGGAENADAKGAGVKAVLDTRSHARSFGPKAKPVVCAECALFAPFKF
jgi:hypothetical protein